MAFLLSCHLLIGLVIPVIQLTLVNQVLVLSPLVEPLHGCFIESLFP